MKKIILFCFAIVLSGKILAQYKPADEGSSLQFTVQNLGFDVNGTFKGLQGAINFDPAKTAASLFDVTVESNTVNTDNSLRDSHLREDSYFDVQHFPKIHFVSTEVSGQNGSYKVTGKLTIKKTTKVVSFPFTAAASGDGYLFKGKFKIKRRDYDVGGFSTISDELVVELNVAAKKS
jgi:polyisoprenoid-binding protein YceI